MALAPPRYFDRLIEARRAGHVGRHVHFGYWEFPSALTVPPEPGEFAAAQANLTDRMIDLLPLLPGQRVLDAACGFGGTLASIDARLHDMSLTGLNIDRRQLLLCHGAVTGSGNRLALVQADACALPFAAATFDHLLCVEAMFHFRSRRVFLAEAARILRPGGQLALCDILLREPSAGAPWPRDTIAAIVFRDHGPWPDLWVRPQDLKSWAIEAGLELADSQDWSAETLPTYRTVAPNERPEQQPNPTAGDVFRWLHSNGFLTYQALLLRRPCS